MKFTEKFNQSPNISKNTIEPKGIVLHHTAGSFVGSVAWCLDVRSKVSYHCIINTNGDRQILARDNQRAWHAGVSKFKGQNNCNNFLLGIAVSGDTNKRELTINEIESVAMLCVDKMRQHNFGLDMVTTHREISPGRKDDIDIRAEKAIKDRIRQLITTINYEVKAGDTLWNIASRFKTTTNIIRQLNKLESNNINVGQILFIP